MESSAFYPGDALNSGEKKRYLPAGNGNGFLSVPRRVVGHYLGMSGDVLRRQLWQLIRLRVNPPKRLHLLEVLVLRQSVGQVDRLMGAPLWHQRYAPDLLHLRVVRWTDSIQVTGNLKRSNDEVQSLLIRINCLHSENKCNVVKYGQTSRTIVIVNRYFSPSSWRSI